MAGITEELRGDATLLRFNSLDELARGHIEAHKTAKAKAVPLPGDTDESRKAFADALRPESIDSYDFGEVSELLDKELVEGFREHAFNEAVPPHMAKGAVDFLGEAMAKQVEKANADSQADVDAFKREYGGQYDTKLAAVQKMLESFIGTPMQIGEADLNRFDMKFGSANLMKAMFAIHDRIGDLAPAGGGEVPAGVTAVAPESAEASLNAKFADAKWRAQAKIEGTAEHRENQYLQKMIAQYREAQQRA